MDPEQALKDARDALAGFRQGVCEDARWQLEQAGQLADAFEALDGWLSRGGFLPSDWAR